MSRGGRTVVVNVRVLNFVFVAVIRAGIGVPLTEEASEVFQMLDSEPDKVNKRNGPVNLRGFTQSKSELSLHVEFR